MAVSAEAGSTDAILSGAAVTRFRTAAASAVATEALARKDSNVVRFIGAGARAHAHLQGLSTVMSVGLVRVWSRSPLRRQEFARESRDQGFTIEVHETAEAVVKGSDVVCTLTPEDSSRTRQLVRRRPARQRRGCPSETGQYREIDTEGIRRASVFVDSWRGAMAESGDVLIPLGEKAINDSHFRREIGQVLAGSTTGRISEEEVTLYNSLGTGL